MGRTDSDLLNVSAIPVLLQLSTKIIVPEKIDSLTGSGFDKPHADATKKFKEHNISQVLIQLLCHFACS